MTAVDPVRESGSVAGRNKSVESPAPTGMFDIFFAESTEGVALQREASDAIAFVENAPLIPQATDGSPTPEGNLDFSIMAPYFPMLPAEWEIVKDTPDLAPPALVEGDTVKSMEGSVGEDEAAAYASLPRADLDISDDSNAPIPVATNFKASTANPLVIPESDLNNSDSQARPTPSHLVKTPLPTSASEVPMKEGQATSNIALPPVQNHTQDMSAEQPPLKDKAPLPLKQQKSNAASNSVNAPIKTAPEPLKVDTPSPTGTRDIQPPLSNDVSAETRAPSQTVRQGDYDSVTLVHSEESKERTSVGQQNNNSSPQPASAFQKPKVQAQPELQNTTNFSAVDEGVSQTLLDTNTPLENDAIEAVARVKPTNDGVAAPSRGTLPPLNAGENFQLPAAPPSEVTTLQQAATQVALSPSLANAQMTLDTRNAQWRSRMVEHTVTRAADGAESINISFRPKNLGDIHLQVEVKNNETQLRVVAETQAAARLVLANEDILSRLMDQAGLRLSNVSVQVSGQGLGMGHSMAQNSNGQSGSNDRPPRKDVIRGGTTSTPRAQSNAIMDDHANGIINVLA